jgi:hypothetical protein
MANFGIGGGFALGLGIPLQYPNVNGFAYSWASVEFRFSGAPIVTVQSIDYKAVHRRKQPFGTNVNPLAKTRGQIDNTCKVKILLAELDQFLGALGALDITGNNAYGDVFFVTTVKYAEFGAPIIIDTLNGCTVDSVEQSSSEGVDAIMAEMELNPLQILRNGRPMSSQLLTAPQFP